MVQLIQCDRCGVENSAHPQLLVCNTCIAEVQAEQREWEEQMYELERREREQE